MECDRFGDRFFDESNDVGDLRRALDQVQRQLLDEDAPSAKDSPPRDGPQSLPWHRYWQRLCAHDDDYDALPPPPKRPLTGDGRSSTPPPPRLTPPPGLARSTPPQASPKMAPPPCARAPPARARQPASVPFAAAAEA